MLPRPSSLVAGVATLCALAGAGAQQTPSCHFLCPPKVLFQPGMIRTHVVDAPRVQSLTTGAVTRIPSRTSTLLVVTMIVPTSVRRLSFYGNFSWLPNATRKTNPFTEYTASDVGDQSIHANAPTVDMGALLALISKQDTKKWLAIDAGIVDQYSAAAQPGAEGAYSHKLDLQGIGTWGILGHLPVGKYLQGTDILTVIDYVATGLPHKGDEVPKGERVFLSDARSVSFTVQLSLPIAPLMSSQ